MCFVSTIDGMVAAKRTETKNKRQIRYKIKWVKSCRTCIALNEAYFQNTKINLDDESQIHR